MKTFYTYLWLREDGSVYYVGKGKDNRAFRKGSPPAERILLQDYPDEESAFAAEKFLISFYGRKDLGTGCLRNHTDGGEGLRNLSDETRAKMSTAAKRTRNSLGYKFTDEQKKRLSEAHKGQVPWHTGKGWPLEVRQRMSAFRMGKTFTSPETYKKLGERFSGTGNPFYGKKHSPETLEQLKRSLKGRKVWNKGIPLTEERKAAISESLRGKKQSPETIAKRLATMEARHPGWQKEMSRLGTLAQWGKKHNG